MTPASTNHKLLKSEQTKSRIMDVYLNLMSKKKWDKISVKEICSQAAITRGTFYQYFNDIYDLMEQIQEPLLEKIKKSYKQLAYDREIFSTTELVEEKFNYSPPKTLTFWFDFCKLNKKEFHVLLGPNGDSYFITKLKNILSEQINDMMDHDYMPHDELRTHFTKAFLELHFLVARTWLDSGDDNFLSTEEIITILNTMRIGAKTLAHQNQLEL